MINNKTISLVCVDCANHELALMAMNHCLNQCHFFDEALFLTDISVSSNLENFNKIQQVMIDKIQSKQEYSLFVLSQLDNFINTDYILLMQWDGYITNPHLWTNEFLDYDYIGARWWWIKDQKYTVGNGGFSWRSKKLLFATKIISSMTSDGDLLKNKPEDALIGRYWRDVLESGFNIKYPLNAIADQFSHEGLFDFKESFGFHGLADMWRYLLNSHHENLFFNYVQEKQPFSPEEIEIVRRRMNLWNIKNNK